MQVAFQLRHWYWPVRAWRISDLIMPCYHPLQGWRKQGGGLTFNLRDGFIDRPVTVSCGQCIGCRLERSRQWAVRCMHEASLHTDNCFITLTYDDDGLSNLPRCVDSETGEIGAALFIL